MAAMRRREPVTGAIRAAIEASRTGGRIPRRHPADVTADRLVDHAIDTRWTNKLNGHERDCLGVVVNALREIAGGER